ncbi:MAG: flagellar motor switch phosphatase FliY [Lachnospiraceae bacterium]|jgi:flagellar motor switch protein FliN/FliY|nr:flagellar motor switch phosphatase FliY [Lachnospiraceae bacterium]
MDGLSAAEIDILGEIANISIGNAATTLSMMVNHKVDITMPNVKIVRRSEVLDDYEKKCILVQIHYIKGLSGNNVFILKEPDVVCMTDLMMGGPGNSEGEVGELQLSAISEAMNQMMGASATSMSVMLSEMVDISTPEVSTIDVDSIKTFEKIFEDGLEAFVKISFKMDVENLIDSSMVQFYPISFARDMCRMFKENGEKLAMEA